MIPQYSNQLMSSLMLWLNNTLLVKGQAFTNTSSRFYPIGQTISGYYTYAAPYNQFVADMSVPGANIMTGVYLDNSFIQTGQSGFFDINYEKGHIYFTNPITGSNRLSGSYAVKDYNIHLTSEPEEKILFETKMSIRPKVGNTPTGLYSNQITYPAIFVKKNDGHNEPLAFGGLDNTITNVTLMIFADSAGLLDATTSLLEDRVRTFIPLLSVNEMPYNIFGGFKTSPFNYTGVSVNKISSDSGAFITRVGTSKFNQRQFQDIKELNPEIHFSLVDITIEKPRYPRL